MRDQALWTWHIVAGGVILVLLGMHMTIMHLDAIVGVWNPAGGLPIDWGNVIARARSAGLAFSYVLLLGTALFHGLYGLRNIIFELNPARSLRQFLNVLFVVGGIGLFAFGTWAAIAGHNIASHQAAGL